MATILSEIKKAKSRVFRRLYFKRRSKTTGLFESTWQEKTDDVKSWGRITKSIDAIRYSRVRFSDLNIVMANDDGAYNPHDDDSSFWSGYASQQRSLVKIEAGFLHQTLGSNGIWTNTYLPSTPTVFIGIIQGDIPINDTNEIILPTKPLLQVFRDFATDNLTGLISAGMTASQFIAVLRDQTDGSSNYIFRPFFGDTTTNWEFTSSSIVYRDLHTGRVSNRPTGSDEPAHNDFVEMNVWEALEKLAEAENMIPYITREGIFKFTEREPNDPAAVFAFYGRGFENRAYGSTIKGISSYKVKSSDYYSRVEVKWNELSNDNSIIITQSALAIGNTNFWNYGHRTYKIENYWLATESSAISVANTIFAAVNSLPKEVRFTSSFVPHLEILDVVTLNYDSGELDLYSRWDLANWAPTSGAGSETDLIWSASDPLYFNGDEFKLTAIEIDLDAFECQFTAIKTGGFTRHLGGIVGLAIIGESEVG